MSAPRCRCLECGEPVLRPGICVDCKVSRQSATENHLRAKRWYVHRHRPHKRRDADHEQQAAQP
jgi:hypothetical protein